MKKTLAIMLALIMVLALVPTVAFAEEPKNIYVNAIKGDDTTGKGTETEPYETVGKAAAEAVSGDTIMLGEGNYTLYNIPSDNTTKGKNLTFIGQGFDKTTWNIGTGTVDVFGQGNGDFSFNGSGTIEFQNMTLKAAVINGTGEQVDRNYTGFAHTTNTIVKNCTVNGKTFYWGYTSATFTNTTFNCPAGDYAVWTYSSPTMTFDNCTFNSTGKVINVYTDYSAGKHNITVNFNNCTVNNEEGTSLKPVLNINDSNMGDFKYILNITGDNKVTGVNTDNITCSRLFGFGRKPENNSGRSDVTINGEKVWEGGKRVCDHNGVVFTTGSYNGNQATQYTDGYKDNAFTVTPKGLGLFEVKCIYCGHTETSTGGLYNDIELTRTVNQKSNSVSADAATSNKYKVANSNDITVDYTATMNMENLKWQVAGKDVDVSELPNVPNGVTTPWGLLKILALAGQIDDETEVKLTFKFDDNIDLGKFQTNYNNNATTPEAKEKLLKLESNMFKMTDVVFGTDNTMTIKCNWNWNKEAGLKPDPKITLYGFGLPVKDNWNGNKQIDIKNRGCVSGTVSISSKPLIAKVAVSNMPVNTDSPAIPTTIQIPIVGGCKTDEFTLYYGGGSSGDSGHSYYYPTTTPVPVIVIPPKTGDMTVWQSILHFLGIR